MLNGKSILITGGTGSFGRRYAQRVLQSYPKIKRLVIFSRDELKQFEMASSPEFADNPAIRFFIGDIRDKDRLYRALEGVDIAIHAAAMKQVPAAEYNPFEAVKTNVFGAQNLIEACLDNSVSRIIALSTDKAAAPVNLYGATKLCSDKLFTAANRIVGPRSLRISVVRYGNVMFSRGSVIPYFLSKKGTGVLPITHPEMTRFNILLDEGCNMVNWCLKNMSGGEIFVPKIPSYRILDLANAICSDCEKPIVGIRPGEKLHEEMITASDSHHTVDLGKYFAILPTSEEKAIEEYIRANGGKKMQAGQSYTSENNGKFLNIEELRSLISQHAHE